MAVPAYIKEPSISGKSLSTEQTSSDISPEHFPSNLTICSWGISWGRGQSFVFNSLHLISDPAQLPFEPAQTCGTEEEHSLATSCVREALCACLLRALPSASVVPSGPCIGTGNNWLLSQNWLPPAASVTALSCLPASLEAQTHLVISSIFDQLSVTSLQLSWPLGDERTTAVHTNPDMRMSGSACAQWDSSVCRCLLHPFPNIIYCHLLMPLGTAYYKISKICLNAFLNENTRLQLSCLLFQILTSLDRVKKHPQKNL